MCITRVHLYLAGVLNAFFLALKVLTTTSADDSLVYFSQRDPFPELQGASHCPPGISSWALYLYTKFDIVNLERSSFLNGFILLYFVPLLVVLLSFKSPKVERESGLGIFLSL